MKQYRHSQSTAGATGTSKSSDARIDVASVKADFPVLDQEVNGRSLVYLDNAASTQKPKAVIDALVSYYNRDNSNIHRGLHTLAERATVAYENTRRHVAEFIGGVSTDEIVFTSGTTHAINLVAGSWGEANISEGDEILITEMEHHANLIPWMMLAQRKGATVKRIPITDDGYLQMDQLESLLSDRTKIVAVSHMSNVLGTINPLADIVAAAKKHGAVVLADGAQSAPHMPVNVKELDVDFYTFSAHKMLGPTGVGILYGRKELLQEMPPYMTGGEMIQKVTFDEATWADLPHKFEAGTPNIADVVAFDAALSYLEKLGMDAVRQHEIELCDYAIKALSAIDGIEIQGPTTAADRGGALSFTDANIHPHDIGTFLDSRGVAVRAGHHCAQPLMRVMGKVATARASFYVYNDEADIDRLADAIREMQKYFGV